MQYRFFIYFYFITQVGCVDAQTNSQTGVSTFRMPVRDSVSIFYTIKKWHSLNYGQYHNLEDYYESSNDDITYYIGGVFYSPDKLKALLWVGEKNKNAYIKGIVNREKICNTTQDYYYSMHAIIGLRDDTNKMWKIYPFDKYIISCANSEEETKTNFAKYYFSDFSKEEMIFVEQSGKNKGKIVFKKHGYSILDRKFWEKCWLFQKDTVGSNGLYSFEIKEYSNLHSVEDRCINCAEKIDLPIVEYPKQIIELYK